jgi:ribosome biogenesis protein
MATTSEPSTSQVRIRLRSSDGKYPLPDRGAILVPLSFRRIALSSLVNGLLEHEKAVPFDFVINGTYLRTSLDQFLSEQGISSETIVDAEFAPAQKVPQYVISFQHDDWVSAVDVMPSSQRKTNQPRILSGCYDGLLRVWDTSSNVLAVSPGSEGGGHSMFIKDARWISPTEAVSVGFNRVARIWKYQESDDGLSAVLKPSVHLYGHKESINAVAVDPRKDGKRLLTASLDCNIGLWSTSKSGSPPAPPESLPQSSSNKKRKLNPSVTQRGPLSMLEGHSEQVTGVTFDSQNTDVAYSVSWDETMRTWHLPSSSVVDTRKTDQALLSIHQLPEMNLIATGTAGVDIKLIDPRVSASAVTAMVLKGHKNAVVCLASDPNNGYNLASGSHDGTVRLFDLRNRKQSKDSVTSQSVYTIQRQSLGGKVAPPVGSGCQVYGLCWDNELGLLSAGQDKAIDVYNSQ